MATIQELYSQTSVSISTTEYYLASNSTSASYVTTDALVGLWVDAGNMAAGDEYEVAMHEKVTSGGTQRRIVIGYLVGAQTAPFVHPNVQLMHSWEFSLIRKAGSDRNFTWSIRGVA